MPLNYVDKAMRTDTLRIILGDQLNRDSPLFEEAAEGDCFWMAEVVGESQHVPSHKARSTYFLSAMRHFSQELRSEPYRLEYLHLNDHAWPSLKEALAATLQTLAPSRIAVVQPGDLRMQAELQAAARDADIPLDILSDSHFLSSPEHFAHWARNRKSLRMEYFYREMRKDFGILMDGDGPAGGSWNFDSDNRGSFGREGPGMLASPIRFPPDAITQSAIDDVNRYLAENPGQTTHFDWPVTSDEARQALRDFIGNRLIAFGDYQDAMWTAEPWLYHSRISAALNLKLLNPREVIDAVEQAWRNGTVAINAAEGFIRQVLGWREFVRGLYFTYFDRFSQGNALNANEPLPGFYWTGETHMQCLAQSITQTLELGYAHHIQRLMVTGLFAQLLGVEPQAIHAWYLGIYVDAVEWVEMPNTLGMSQYADGGLMASKPYIASGKYIQRMSNYCDQCRYKPDKRTGEEACPFTVLYWDFLMRHEKTFSKHPRMALQCRNLARIKPQEKSDIRQRAAVLRETVESL